jgi:thiol-disulfide isomerase/thioredoxin
VPGLYFCFGQLLRLLALLGLRYSDAVKIPFVFLSAFVLLSPLFTAAQTASVAGRWDSTLTVERREGNPYQVDFRILVESSNDGANALKAQLVNGSDSKPFSRVQWENGKLTLWLGEYEGELGMSCVDPQCNELEGGYTRLTRKGQMRYGVRARRHAAVGGKSAEWKWPSLAGDWNFAMSSPGAATKQYAPARFEQKAAQSSQRQTAAEIEGTVAEVSGDYGMLHGEITVENKPGSLPTFHLSRFDGIHTTLLEGSILADGSMHGTIAFSPMSTVEFTANRKANAPETAGNSEAEHLTKMKSAEEPFHFAGVDLRTGNTVTQAEFAGKPLIIDVFGTWCPNCHDEAPLLREIYGRYHAQGLEVVGLSFEYTDDKARNTRLIEFFRKKYNVEYPLLLAGTTDEAQKKLPQLEGFGAFPTTIFIDRRGRVLAVHAGFEGAATGQLDDVSRRFDELVQEILKAE